MGRVSRYFLTLAISSMRTRRYSRPVRPWILCTLFRRGRGDLQRVHSLIREQGEVGLRTVGPCRFAAPRSGVLTMALSVLSTTKLIRKRHAALRGVLPTRRSLSPGFFARSVWPIVPPHQALLVSDRSSITTRAKRSSISVNDKKEVVSPRAVRMGAVTRRSKELEMS